MHLVMLLKQLHGCAKNQQTFFQMHTDTLLVALAHMTKHCKPHTMSIIHQQTFQNNHNLDVFAST